MKKIIALSILIINFSLYAQTQQDIQKILSNYNVPYLENLRDSLKTAGLQNWNYTLQQASINNWPLHYTTPGGETAKLSYVFADGKPAYLIPNSSTGAGIDTRTNLLNTGGSLGLGLDGEDMNIGIWEFHGVPLSHQEYVGRVTHGDTPNMSNPGYVAHAAYVTGIIIGTGVDPNAKGMAPLATAIAYDEHIDSYEVQSEILSSGLLISNHSYGLIPNNLPDHRFGNYTNTARTWDNIMYNSPYYLQVTSAGNYAFLNLNPTPVGGVSQHDQLTSFKVAKNNIVVANATNINLDVNDELISADRFHESARGPSDDYRIKPDLSGSGVDVYSAWGPNNNSYHSDSGTSAASPNVAGSLLLLQEYNRDLHGEFMRAATLKGLALHTADDIEIDGPDPDTGWGLLNSKRAAVTMTNNGTYSIISEKTLENNATYTIDVYSDGNEPLLASISWTDLPGVANPINVLNDTTPKLINDLDIRVTDNINTFFPYALATTNTNAQMDNFRDPFERIDIDNPAAGYYTITVTHKGSLQGTNSSQNYSLIVTGIVVCTSQDDEIVLSDTVLSNEAVHEHAIQSIVSTSDIQLNTDVHYRAGNFIVLTSGFHSVSQSLLLAEINRCTDGYDPQSSSRPGGASYTNNQSESPENSFGKEDFKIYPNPSKANVTIGFHKGISNIKVISIDGKVVHQITSNGNLEHTFNVDELNSGIYLVNVETLSGEILTKKLIVK